MKIERWDAARDGPVSEAALRERLAERGYRVSRQVYPPGTHFPAHSHPLDKLNAVLAGRFRMAVAGVSVTLAPGDLLAIPRETLHTATVVGNEPVVVLDSERE